MTIPWLTRLPTPEEVAAHAAAHPILTGEYGLWLRALPQDKAWVRPGAFRHLLVLDDSVQGWGHGDHDAGARWLPCTAEGIPVCLLPVTPGQLPCLADDEDRCEWEYCPRMMSGDCPLPRTK